MYLLIDFVNYFPNFLFRNRLYNACLGFKAQNVGIEGVIFKASRSTRLFQFYKVGAGRLEEIFIKSFLILQGYFVRVTNNRLSKQIIITVIITARLNITAATTITGYLELGWNGTVTTTTTTTITITTGNLRWDGTITTLIEITLLKITILGAAVRVIILRASLLVRSQIS